MHRLGLAVVAAAAAALTPTACGGGHDTSAVLHAHAARTMDSLAEVPAAGPGGVSGSVGEVPSTHRTPSTTSADRASVALANCEAAFGWGELLPGCRLFDGEAWLDGGQQAYAHLTPGAAVEVWVNKPKTFRPETLAGVDLGDLDRLGKYKLAVCRAAERQAQLPVGCTTTWQGHRVTAVRETPDGFIPYPAPGGAR